MTLLGTILVLLGGANLLVGGLLSGQGHYGDASLSLMVASSCFIGAALSIYGGDDGTS